jgi:DNA-binding FrmR family transcriptional regulator
MDQVMEHTIEHTQVLRRLKNAEGHLRGIQRMIEEDAYCIDVIRQVKAVQSALNKVSKMVLEDHMHTCVITAVQGEDPAERERVLREIAEVYEEATKV